MIGAEAIFLSEAAVFVERTPQLRIAQTGSTETPLPSDMGPPVLMDLGTQPRALRLDTGDLAASARRYMTALAAIPVDPRVDASVEALVREHDRPAGKHRITRK